VKSGNPIWVCKVSFPYTGWFSLDACWFQRTIRWWWRNSP